MLNYYQILGISATASQKEIVVAYRAKCKLLHPDVNPSADATAQMQMVNEAYRVLKNESLRYVYDRQFVNRNRTAVPRENHHAAAYGGASCAYHSRFYETSSWSDDFKKRKPKRDLQDYWWFFYLIEIPYSIIDAILSPFMKAGFRKRR